MFPRVAYFPDSFHEVNGVAHTSRNFVAFAERRGMPLLCVRAGAKDRAFEQRGELRTLELKRSRLAVGLEWDLHFDPMFFWYRDLISKRVREFRPDVIHITGPSELGMFGAYFSWKLGIPLAASWHTNVHEYAARRIGWAPQVVQRGVEAGMLEATSRFYRMAKVLYAPNPQLCALLESRTGRACHLVRRGVDTEFFSPAKRTRVVGDGTVVLGYVGRLSVEKNLALLPRIEKELRQRGMRAQWVIVGHGAEAAMLRDAFGAGAMKGVLRGESLARAYADMDLLVFPSHTDTFGNVVLEALASGVPALVTPDGGPAHIVQDGVTGRMAPDEGFSEAIVEALADPVEFAGMRKAARAYAMSCSWDEVFERVVAAYPVGERTVTT